MNKRLLRLVGMKKKRLSRVFMVMGIKKTKLSLNEEEKGVGVHGGENEEDEVVLDNEVLVRLIQT